MIDLTPVTQGNMQGLLKAVRMREEYTFPLEFKHLNSFYDQVTEIDILNNALVG
jgi:hypothetical protein